MYMVNCVARKWSDKNGEKRREEIRGCWMSDDETNVNLVSGKNEKEAHIQSIQHFEVVVKQE